MCGIAGILDFSDHPVERARLERMTRLLAHRGPDGEGVFLDGPAGLGHRRLSILDLAAGAQPMASDDGRYTITFNGEIFNYVELREELRAAGRAFCTASDTEVLLQAFRQWGVDGFSRLNGQFAFAIYDRERRELTLARDMMGEKPLFHSLSGSAFVFASELKSILAYLSDAGSRPELSPYSVSAFLSLNYVPFNATFIKGVRQLEPGRWMRVRGGHIEEGSFVTEQPAQAFGTLSQAAEALEEALARSVRLRLRSDVPVGIFLSGGVDSTCVAAALPLDGAVTAFTANFHEAGFSEVQQAREVSRRLGIPLEEFDIAPAQENIPQLIEELVDHGDTPLADSSSLPVYLLSRQTSKRVKVVLSGDGGDELFGGYLTYQATDLARRIPAALMRFLTLLHPLLGLVPASNAKVGLLERVDRFMRNADLPPGAAHFAWNGMFRAREKAALLRPEFAAQLQPQETFSDLARAAGVGLDTPTWRQLTRADQSTYLAGDILAKVDRMTMAHGLEARPVLLDPQVVRLARSLPDGFLGDLRSRKLLLKEVLRCKAPWYDLTQPKRGFSIPIHLWFRTVLREYFEDLLRSPVGAANPVFQQEAVLKLWERHQRRRCNAGFELWGIMVALLWMRRFLRV